MSFKLKQNLPAILTLTVIATLIGCASTGGKTATERQANVKPATTETKTSESGNKGGVTVQTETGTKTTIEGKDGEPPTTIHDNSTKTVASSGDKVGVAECDDYIAKYEACLTGKVPAASRAAFESSIAQMRQTWKQVAANPQAKAALASGCKQAQEASKQSMAAYSCDW